MKKKFLSSLFRGFNQPPSWWFDHKNVIVYFLTSEKYPEWNGGLRDPEHADQDHEREDSERGVGVGVDIRVSEQDRCCCRC